jgi:hypothetical protein
MNLSERIKSGPEERREMNLMPFVERRIDHRPVWLRRMQDGQLKAKDLTGERAA